MASLSDDEKFELWLKRTYKKDIETLVEAYDWEEVTDAYNDGHYRAIMLSDLERRNNIPSHLLGCFKYENLPIYYMLRYILKKDDEIIYHTYLPGAQLIIAFFYPVKSL
jgi:hypothetical protein